MDITLKAWAHDAPIPEKYAFGKIPAEGRFDSRLQLGPRSHPKHEATALQICEYLWHRQPHILI